MPHISLSAEKIFQLGPFFITNSILTTWLVMFFFLLFIIYLNYQRVSLIPNNLQLFLELIIDGLYSLFATVVGTKIKLFFPLLATFFLFIILNNWSGLLPGIGAVGIIKIDEEHYGEEKFIPLLRAGTADLNTTLGLAVVSVLAIQYYGIKTLGFGQFIKRYFNFQSPINFFVGILELVSEFAKIISFAFRLFGNIFAGEVLLTVVAFLMPLFAPLPFLGLELFVGLIQALVFSMLSAVFLSVATQKENH